MFPQIISFMKSHTRIGKDILVVPETPSLYFFGGMQSPSRWYEAQPGVLDPKQELASINEAESAHVQYVLLCHLMNRYNACAGARKAGKRIAELPAGEPARVGGDRKLHIFRWGGAYYFQFRRELWYWRPKPRNI
jgi:hypothetical protein